MRMMLFAALAATGAVSPAHAESEEKEDAADPRIGKEVNRICFPRNINNWRTIKGEDNVLLLEEAVNDWYRVELVGPCRYRDLRFTQAIALEKRPSGGCLSRGDTVKLLDNDNFDLRCTITQINAWDEDAAAPDEEEGA